MRMHGFVMVGVVITRRVDGLRFGKSQVLTLAVAIAEEKLG